ncbi:MAG TPA: MFS transporter [Gemmatimonadaceae bacterium]|nr:MFS transporter [Gemmatimonadaceae bacterium]
MRAQRSDLYPWYVVGVLMLANVSFWVDRQILVLLIGPIQRDFGITKTQVSFLIGLPFAVLSALLTLPIARMSDSGRRRPILSIGVALWSIMTSLCGLAGSYTRLLFARVGVGVGEATLQPAAISLLADYFSRERLATATSVYSTTTFLGSGLAYLVGGWVVGIASTQAAWSVPLVGSVRPWQSVFLIVGIPGLLIALLMLTVREPERRDRTRGTVSLRELFAYVRANGRTFLCVSLGFALSATVNFGIAAWLVTFLIEKHGWTASRAGVVQGSLTMTIGMLGVVVGGRVSDLYVRRGAVDGPLRVGIIGAIGMLVSATAYPLAGSAAAAVAWLAVVNFFAAFPWGAASTAAAEAVPASMRAQGTALYFLVLNLFSVSLGPIVVALVADKVFGDSTAIASSLATVNLVGMTGAIAFLSLGRSAYRRTLATRDR